MMDLNSYRTPSGLVIEEEDWARIRADTPDLTELAKAMCSAMEGMPMPDSELTEMRALAAFTDLRSTPLESLLECGPINLLRSPTTRQPYYHTRLKPPGGSASNYLFHKLRLRTPKAGAPSVWEKWHDPLLRLMVCFKFLKLKYPTRVNNSTIRLALHATGETPAQFKPGVAKAVYELTGAKHVLDLSMGWGDRLAGFCASACTEKYTGIDPNQDLHPVYRQQIGMYGMGKQFDLIEGPAEDASVPAESMDLVFTSPPYFGVEKYGSGTGHEATQSWKRYPTGLAWRDGFLRPVVALAWNALRQGGVLAINLADAKHEGEHYPLCAWLSEIVQALPGSHFQFALGMRLQGSNYTDERRGALSGEPIWMWSKGDRSLPIILPGLRSGKSGPSGPSALDAADDVSGPVRPKKKSVKTGFRGTPPIDPITAAKVVADYLAGEGGTTVARRHKISSPTVRKLVIRAGHESRSATPRRAGIPNMRKKKPSG